MRYFFEISYNGAAYHGWQTQLNAKGIQPVVEEALSTLLREKISVIASGRTDTGVHCAQQFFHTDIIQAFDRKDFIHKLNSFLPKDIAIHSIVPVQADASARYDAVERTYHYRIVRKKDPLSVGLAWYYFKPVNVQTMNEAAALLSGEQDFECFSKVNTDVNHFLCTIKEARWVEDGHQLMFIITANRFLRGMVRAIVGTLLDVGTGKTSVADFQKIVHSRDRRKAGANVPPYGLYLMRVRYPEHLFINTGHK